MAEDLTWAEWWTQTADAVDVYDSIRTDGQTSVVTKIDTAIKASEGQGAPESVRRLRRTRSGYASLLDDFRAVIDPRLPDLARIIGSGARAGTRVFWRDVREYMVANSEDVNGRNIAFGAIAGGSNVGNGTIHRLTIDEYDHAIEAVFIDVVTARCVRDQNSGTKVGREVFEISHGDALPDRISEAGSGRRGGARRSRGRRDPAQRVVPDARRHRRLADVDPELDRREPDRQLRAR